MTLPANSTFLPVLDDLLSPDLRPVLQTPTTEYAGPMSRPFANVTSTCDVPRGMSTPNAKKTAHFKTKGQGSRSPPEEERASRKIQHWWRSRRRRRSVDFDIRAERAKHTIRHNRTEEHVIYLETEVSRLKSALSAERKARSLQMDAIRCLWSQVQQMSSSSASESVMTQSMPNGLPASPRRQVGSASGDNQMSASYAGGFESGAVPTAPCTSHCSKEIQLLRESMSTEIAQLRDMLSSLRMDQSTASSSHDQLDGDRCHGNGMEVDNSDSSDGAGVVASDQDQVGPVRPFSLNILGMTTAAVPASGTADTVDMETPEISEYAGVLARNVLEKAVDEEEATFQQGRIPSKIPVKKF